MYVRNLFNAMEYFYIAVFLQLDALLAYYRFDTLTLTLVLSSSLNPLHSFPPFHPFLLLDNHLILCTSTSPLSLFSFRPLRFIPSSFHLAFFTSPHLFYIPLYLSPSSPPPPLPSLRWEVSELHWSRPGVGERWVMTVIRHRRHSPPLPTCSSGSGRKK